MEMLQLREQEVFNALKRIKKYGFVVIGGYAANAYALPRFSVDCDIVVDNKKEAERIAKELEKAGYKKEEAKNAYYGGNFLVYKKELANNFKVSIDIFIEEIIDRQTNASFSAEWAFRNSYVTALKGKTIAEQLSLRIIKIDALIVMKIISCRSTDIRDVFMLIPKANDPGWVKEEISKRCNLNERLNLLRKTVISSQFKDNLQGVYGFIDEQLFEKHKKKIISLFGF